MSHGRLMSATEPDARTLQRPLLAFGACAVLFWVLMRLVDADAGPARFDAPVQRFFVGHRTGGATTVMRGASLLAAWPGVVALSVAVLWCAPSSKRLRTAIVLSVGIAGASVTSSTLKALVERARPPTSEAVSPIGGFAFPSGHVTTATAVFTLAAYLISRHASTRRTVLRTGVAVGVLAVATSRSYLGAHWFTDLLGGMAAGGAWAALVIAVDSSSSSISGSLSGWRGSSRPAPRPGGGELLPPPDRARRSPS